MITIDLTYDTWYGIVFNVSLRVIAIGLIVKILIDVII